MSDTAMPSEGFTFAYQPIVDASRQQVVSFEALVRGPAGEPAYSVLERYPGSERGAFDVIARRRAISLAMELGISCHINLNYVPNDQTETGIAELESLLALAAEMGFETSRLVLEISERDAVLDMDSFRRQVDAARSEGVLFAIDDFGAGFSGLNLLAQFQPLSLKLDRTLVREVNRSGPRQAIIRGVLRTCEDLGIDVVAEGVETVAEYDWLLQEGIDLYQGYLFARPGFETLPTVIWPE